MSIELSHGEGVLTIDELGDGRKQLSVRKTNPDLFVSRSTITTSYPDALIERIFAIKGPGYVCDEIARDEDPHYVAANLAMDLFAYFSPEMLEGKRILDFGCGCGASTMVLTRLLPGASLVGVELDETLLSIAKARAEFYSFPLKNLFQSPSGTQLPDGLGRFDFVIMSAVFEHLLPHERPVVLAQVWRLVRPGGYLFLNQTPHRYWPIESHTTLLPLLNYLPDRLAHFVARHLSKTVTRDESWQDLLRRGIRGGTEFEVMKILAATEDPNFLLLNPARGVRDRIDLWCLGSSDLRWPKLKSALSMALRFFQQLTGVSLVPTLSLAIQKEQKR